MSAMWTVGKRALTLAFLTVMLALLLLLILVACGGTPGVTSGVVNSL